MKKVILEIRASEGGEDAKLLVGDMTNIYTKAAINQGFTVESIEEKDGLTALCL